MTVLEGLVLGLIQGLTEFLPISSSGHLVLFQKIFGLEEGVVTFDVAVHFATLVAVVAVFRKDILELLRRPFCKMTLLLFIGTLPFVVIGAALHSLIESLVESGASLGVEFLITGLILVWASKVRTGNKKLEQTTVADAALIGIAQAAAMMPAISRSGLTIAGALWRGLDREFAARFSFLLSIPAILGAVVWDGRKLLDGSAELPPAVPMIVGMLVAAVSGYIAVRWMLRIIQRGKLMVFAWYVGILGCLVLADQLIFKIYF